MCVKKDPCVRPPSHCEDYVATGLGTTDPDCDSGNYAICRKCDYDGDGTMDFGSCEARILRTAPERSATACLSIL